ncbi:Hvo_1808 family surface protein [Haloprofundus salilacus]|uniref:Hvo_1808 family surface protein n=1 Tax=Haloprofundus salilacus TaxID=2876190 RepID=UPI001CCA8E26|nr:Hvo_1808 family surface protein [Haloprofundus salilacus]
MHTRITLALVVCLVFAGCAAPLTDGSALGDGFGHANDEDRLGWENGYAYDDPLNIDQSDGLNESEREAFVARTMARVEKIRGLEFEEPVPVEVITREEYRQQSGGASDPKYEAWNNQVWESLLLVGEDRNVSDVMDSVYGGSVLGYYSPSEDRIVIVSDSETPTIDRTTLAHELVHALQDQQFGLEGSPVTQDGQLARNGIVEGDARYTETLYERRCGTEWDCVPRPDNGGGGGGGDTGAPGVFLTIYAPYADGPQFVHTLYERGGWDAVNAVYEDKPRSTEQIIHPPKYPNETPANVSVDDRSSTEWSRFDTKPVADTVGEASLYAMFWQNGYIDRESLQNSPDEFSPYNYSHPATEGWAGDAIVPYESDDGEYGYVFQSEWDSQKDAREFADAYRATLTTRLDAEQVGDGVYRVDDDSPFGDAFRVRQNGTTVTIVNAPTTGQLDEVHASD